MFERHIIVSVLALWLSACSGESNEAERDLSSSNNCVGATESLVKIPAGEGIIGSNKGYPEEGPERIISLESFDIDATEVTNAQFEKFVEATGYVTSAEEMQAGFNAPGAAVFVPPDVTHPNWWRFVEGANWRHPEGPESSIEGRNSDPVVQVSHRDAAAYAMWAGRELPSETQWEYAARGGTKTRFVWGESRTIDGAEQANTWQGAFPIQNTRDDGYLRRSPVGCYPPNNFGLYDMIGNVWEWTDTVHKPSETEPIYVLKGGSFLCAENYCRRYRAAAMQPQEAGFPTNHIGFRTVSQKY